MTPACWERKDDMKLKYLGSGGGGGIPEMFCSCPICMNARIKGGRELRRRSMAILDDELLIDVPCDARDSFLAHEVDPTKIRYILITHAHYDHFIEDNFVSRPQGAQKMDLYISYGSGESFAKRCAALAQAPTPPNLRPIHVPTVHLKHPFERFTVGEFEITALDSAHGGRVETLNYLIICGEKALLWLHDSGLLSEAARQWLRGNCPKLSLVSMDCALPLGATGFRDHMNLTACAETADFLRSIGCVDEKTQLILSHLGHNTDMTHEELVAASAGFGFRPAFDGEQILL